MSEGTSLSHQNPNQKDKSATRRSKNNGRRRYNKPKETSNTNKRHPKKKNKQKDINNDYRVLEIFKLIKTFKPITVNGIPVVTIVKQENEKERLDQPDSVIENESTCGQPKEPKLAQAKKKNQHDMLKHYITRIFTNYPDKAIYFSFMIQPSDPDFPFALETLKLSLCIPHTYPYEKESRPTIFILNDEIPKGFAINIEHGFKRITGMAMNNEVDEEIELVNGKGLLSQMQTLDKYLELFLKQEKRDTIKFVKQKKKSRSNSPLPVADRPTPTSPAPITSSVSPSQLVSTSPVVLNQRNQLIDEMINKLGPNVKILKKNLTTKYKIIVPIHGDGSETKFKPMPPKVWCSNRNLELFLNIPLNYPESRLTINIPSNFSEHLVAKNASDNGIIRLKQIEKNLIDNFASYKFKDVNLNFVINWLSNYLGVFCLSKQEFEKTAQLLF